MEPNILAKIEMDCTNVLKYFKSLSDEERPTLTHVVIKATGELLKNAQYLNGKIIFDKFIPYNTVDVTCIVDIDFGEDLALVTLKDVDKMKISEIRGFLNSKSKHIKQNKGDKDHKKRYSMLMFLPPFFIRPLMAFTEFLSYHLGIDVTPLAIKKH